MNQPEPISQERPAPAAWRDAADEADELEALVQRVAKVMPDGSRRDWYMVAELIRRCPSGLA